MIIPIFVQLKQITCIGIHAFIFHYSYFLKTACDSTSQSYNNREIFKGLKLKCTLYLFRIYSSPIPNVALAFKLVFKQDSKLYVQRFILTLKKIEIKFYKRMDTENDI